MYIGIGPTSPSADATLLVAGRAATWMPMFKSLVWLNPEISPRRKWELKPRSAALQVNEVVPRER